jgi:hypothetical protein
MNKLNETSRTTSRVLSDSELTQVVGGNGHHRRWGSGHHGNDNRSRNGRQGNGGGSQLARPLTINIVINNTTTIINNTTFLS